MKYFFYLLLLVLFGIGGSVVIYQFCIEQLVFIASLRMYIFKKQGNTNGYLAWQKFILHDYPFLMSIILKRIKFWEEEENDNNRNRQKQK